MSNVSERDMPKRLEWETLDPLEWLYSVFPEYQHMQGLSRKRPGLECVEATLDADSASIGESMPKPIALCFRTSKEEPVQCIPLKGTSWIPSDTECQLVKAICEIDPESESRPLTQVIIGKNPSYLRRWIHISRALHAGSTWGEIIQHNDKAFIVKFDVGGVSEEREFFWDELSVEPGELPVGTIVIGRTELVKAALPLPENTDREKTRQIRDAVLKQMNGAKPDAGKRTIRVITPEEQAKADQYWVERIAKNAAPNKEKPGNAS
jgi:hypothetical protein